MKILFKFTINNLWVKQINGHNRPLSDHIDLTAAVLETERVLVRQSSHHHWSIPVSPHNLDYIMWHMSIHEGALLQSYDTVMLPPFMYEVPKKKKTLHSLFLTWNLTAEEHEWSLLGKLSIYEVIEMNYGYL